MGPYNTATGIPSGLTRPYFCLDFSVHWIFVTFFRTSFARKLRGRSKWQSQHVNLNSRTALPHQNRFKTVLLHPHFRAEQPGTFPEPFPCLIARSSWSAGPRKSRTFAEDHGSCGDRFRCWKQASLSCSHCQQVTFKKCVIHKWRHANFNSSSICDSAGDYWPNYQPLLLIL